MKIYRPWSKEETALAEQKRDQGETYADIGVMLKRSIWSVKNHLSEMRQTRQQKPRERSIFVREATPYPGVERCRCGLALPCNACLPSITDLAGSRRGDAQL